MTTKNRKLINNLKQAISTLEVSESFLRKLDQELASSEKETRDHLESANARTLDRALMYVAYVHEELLRQTKPAESYEVINVVYPTREKPEKILDAMFDMIHGIGKVSVLDYYLLTGGSGHFSDKKFEKLGWFDLRRADIKPVGEGYIINLPRPVKINN